MKTIAELLSGGCYFCKKPLALETAVIGNVSYALVGTNVWSTPTVVACCIECSEKHKTEE